MENQLDPDAPQPGSGSAPTVTPGTVGPKGWQGTGNPVTDPDATKRPVGRPRTTVGSPPGAAVAVIPASTVAPVPAQAPSRKRSGKGSRAPGDENIAFAAHLPEPLVATKPKNLTEIRVELLRERRDEWGRIRVLVSKSGALDIARGVNAMKFGPWDSEDEATRKPVGMVEAKVIQTTNGYELWARWTNID